MFATQLVLAGGMAKRRNGKIKLPPPKREKRAARKALKAWGLPAWRITLVVAALNSGTTGLAAVEVFSGEGQLGTFWDNN